MLSSPKKSSFGNIICGSLSEIVICGELEYNIFVDFVFGTNYDNEKNIDKILVFPLRGVEDEQVREEGAEEEGVCVKRHEMKLPGMGSNRCQLPSNKNPITQLLHK